LENEILLAMLFVFTGIVFDFFDGFAARILHVKSEMGKQLDSLADLVTSGVVPGLAIYKMLNPSGFTLVEVLIFDQLPLVGLIIPIGAAFRLAFFNIDTRQTDHFIGLPTPAAALLVLSVPCMLFFPTADGLKEVLLSPYFLVGFSVFIVTVMNAPIKLFSLKFKNFKWRGNELRYSFIFTSVILLMALEFAGLALVILMYLFSGLFSQKLH
ncbi:MAG: phosphatidylserine synthase, partial [Polaribacter sp. BACL8 MAG-120619-bin41]